MSSSKNNYIYIFLIVLSMTSFIYGFVVKEDSAGGGLYDFNNTWNNQTTFNENSLKIINVKAERSVENSKVGQIFQFQRKGYFVVDDDSKKGSLIFNRTVELRDNWTKKN